MSTPQRILVPTDLSANGTRALEEAQQYAAAFSATIDVLYVWSPPVLVAPEAVMTGAVGTEQPLLEWLSVNAREMLDNFTNQARSAGVPVEHSFCEPGDPADAIIERATSGKYDLLVMSTHGRTGLSHLLMGSVAEKVVRRAPCPVLTVRAAI